MAALSPRSATRARLPGCRLCLGAARSRVRALGSWADASSRSANHDPPEGPGPRFVTIRRGGTLTDSDHHLLALWATSWAEHIPDLFESTRPEDPRPRQAIEHAPAWVRGKVKMTQARAAGGYAMGAARDLRGAARHAAYAAGQARAVAHVAAHELGAARSSWTMAAIILAVARCAGCCITRVMSAGERAPRKLALETISLMPLTTAASKTAACRLRTSAAGSAVRRPAVAATLSAPIRLGLIAENPASRAVLPRARRPRAVVWMIQAGCLVPGTRRRRRRQGTRGRRRARAGRGQAGTVRARPHISAYLFEERFTMAAPGWPQSGPTHDQKRRPGVIKPQVRTGAPPGTRTPNPRN